MAMTKAKPQVMSAERAAAIVADGMPEKAPATASLDEYKAASRAIRLYQVALEICEKGREAMQAELDRVTTARRVNGCGCDNAPDCLCDIR